MRIRRKHSGPNGFTLLEMLVALSITAVILAALYSSFFVIQRSVHASEETLTTLHEARAALDVIRREIEGAFTSTSAGNSEVFTLKDRDFYGAQASTISFLTHASTLHGPARVSYRVEDIDGRLTLIKSLTTVNMPKVDAPEAEMVERISSFTVEALKHGTDWVRTWDQRQMPTKVRISLEVPIAERTVTLTVTAISRNGGKI